MKKLVFLALVVFAFTSCRVMWVPAKSPNMIASVIEVQNSTANLYANMLHNTDKYYTTYAPDYQSIETKIDSLVSINKERPHARNIYNQCLFLQKYFKKYEAEHKEWNTLTDSQIRVYRAYIQSFIKPILVSELALK